MWPYSWTHVGTPSHLGHMDRLAATMPSQAHAGAAQEAHDIGQWEGQDVPLVRASCCNVKGGIPSSRRYLPTYLSVLVVVRVWVCFPRVFVCVCVCVCVVCWCVGGVWLPVLASTGCCWCWWGCGWCVLWLVPCHSWRRFLCATPRHSWLGFAAAGGGCSETLLAEGPGCGSPPLLAGVRWRWWCAAPRHSWLGPAGCAGVFRGWGCPLLCVFVVCVAARGGGAVLCVVCLWCPRCWWCGVVVGRLCVFHVRGGVRGCVCVVCRSSVVCGLLSRLFWLGLAAGVCVGVVGVWCGSPATPG